MANALKRMRKENNEMDKQLTEENNAIITDMIVYLNSADISEYDIEVMRKEIIGMALEAQIRNESMEEVIGGDYKVFCNELMKNCGKKSIAEKIIGNLYVLVAGFGILFLEEIIFSTKIHALIADGKFSMPISLGFAVSSVISIISAFLIYYLVTKKSFELSLKGINKYKCLFVGGVIVIFISITAIKVVLEHIELFNVNIFAVAAVFAVGYIVVKILEDKLYNSIVNE